MNTIPQAEGLPVPPYAAEVFVDFERGNKQFVTLCFRHKAAGPRDDQWALVLAVLDGLTAAGLIVERDGLEIRLIPEIAAVAAIQTPDTPYRIHIKVPVKPQAEAQADMAAFAQAIRARFGR